MSDEVERSHAAELKGYHASPRRPRRRAIIVAVLGATLAALVWAALALAATGDLRFSDCISGETESAAACTQTAGASSNGTESGLDQLRAVTVSADGKNAYAASEFDAAVVTFDRNAATGKLTYTGCISGETPSISCTQVPGASSDGTNSGFSRLRSVTISPDGKSVYAASFGDDSVVSFDRDTTTGDLTYAGCISGETGSSSCTQTTAAAVDGNLSGLDQLAEVSVSPDGKSVYAVAEADDAIATFSRDTSTGALTYSSCISGDSDVTACGPITSATSGGINSGLDFPQSVSVSPDGASVYLAAAFDASIATFYRNTTSGDLTYAGCISGETQSAAACAQLATAASAGNQSGVDDPSAVSVSPDGESVYVAAEGDDAIASFDRDTATGALTFSDCISGETGSAGSCTLTPSATSSGFDSGLDKPLSLAIRPDGSSVYVVASEDAAISDFDRDPGSGALTYSRCISGETESAGCDQIPSASSFAVYSGLELPQSVAVSPDSVNVYVASAAGDAVASFDREPPPQCSDGLDNDGDGKVDFPADPGCSGTGDNDETDPPPPPAPIPTPTPTPVPSPTPDADTKVTDPDVTLAKRLTVKGKELKIKVSAGAQEGVKATGKGTVVIKPKKGRGKAKTTELKPVTKTIEGGERTILRLKYKGSKKKRQKLTKKLVKSIKQGKKARVRVQVVLTDTAGNSTTEKRVSRLKAKKGKRK